MYPEGRHDYLSLKILLSQFFYHHSIIINIQSLPHRPTYYSCLQLFIVKQNKIMEKTNRESFDFYMPSQRTSATAQGSKRRFSTTQINNNNYSYEIQQLRLLQSAKGLESQALDPLYKLRDLRDRRKQIEDKFLKITTRMNFMRKKQNESLRSAMDAKSKLHSIYILKSKRMHSARQKQEMQEKKKFEEWKRNQEVESFRQNLQLNKKVMVETSIARKQRQVQKLKSRKISELRELQKQKHAAFLQKQQIRDRIMELHQKQAMKKKLFEMSKKLTCRDNVQQKIELYENETAKIYEVIEHLKRKQFELMKQNEHSTEIFKSVLQDFQKLKSS